MIGGTTYVFIEIAWRGHSHISMFILGGVCFLLLGYINEYIPWEMGLIWQCLIGAGIVTCAEYITGMIVNVWLGLGVWDYSNMPFNLHGQICLPFCFVWMLLSFIGIVLDDWLRYWFWGEERPHYTIW